VNLAALFFMKMQTTATINEQYASIGAPRVDLSTATPTIAADGVITAPLSLDGSHAKRR
jgi:hypothetical protein